MMVKRRQGEDSGSHNIARKIKRILILAYSVNMGDVELEVVRSSLYEKHYQRQSAVFLKAGRSPIGEVPVRI